MCKSYHFRDAVLNSYQYNDKTFYELQHQHQGSLDVRDLKALRHVIDQAIKDADQQTLESIRGKGKYVILESSDLKTKTQCLHCGHKFEFDPNTQSTEIAIDEGGTLVASYVMCPFCGKQTYTRYLKG